MTGMSDLEYAAKIQRSLLPRASALQRAFTDYAVMWRPKNIVSGDTYWMKQFAAGTVLCVCDCTGHGIPGALLTILVMSALENNVHPNNCQDTAGIIWNLDRRLHSTFKRREGEPATDIQNGCDIAALFISTGGDIVLSSGHMHVFVCNGETVEMKRGQKIFIGEGRIKLKTEVRTTSIPYDVRNKIYIASDGLFDQNNGKDTSSFGYKRFERCILDSHDEPQHIIVNQVLEAFEAYRGEQKLRDDVTLVTIKP